MTTTICFWICQKNVLDLSTKCFGFVDNIFWICRRNFCKSLLCSMFNEQTCSGFTWLFVRSVVTMPKICLKTFQCYIFEMPKDQGHQKWYSQLSNAQLHKYNFTEKNPIFFSYFFFFIFLFKNKIRNFFPGCFDTSGSMIRLSIAPNPQTQPSSPRCYKFCFIWLKCSSVTKGNFICVVVLACSSYLSFLMGWTVNVVNVINVRVAHWLLCPVLVGKLSRRL